MVAKTKYIRLITDVQCIAPGAWYMAKPSIAISTGDWLLIKQSYQLLLGQTFLDPEFVWTQNLLEEVIDRDCPCQ